MSSVVLMSSIPAPPKANGDLAALLTQHQDWNSNLQMIQPPPAPAVMTLAASAIACQLPC